MSYSVGTSVTVSARHVMPGMPPPEGERHAHDYRLEVVVSRGELDDRGMVCDLDALEDALRGVAAVVDGSDLDHVVPAARDAVTVEAFARWVHDSLGPAVRDMGGERLSVRVWESAVAFGGYEGSLA